MPFYGPHRILLQRCDIISFNQFLIGGYCLCFTITSNFATLIISPGELMTNESVSLEERLSSSSHPLTTGAQNKNSFVAIHPSSTIFSSLTAHQHPTRHSSQPLQTVRRRRRQARFLLREVWPHPRVFAPATPPAGLFSHCQSHCTFSHFFQNSAHMLPCLWPARPPSCKTGPIFLLFLPYPAWFFSSQHVLPPDVFYICLFSTSPLSSRDESKNLTSLFTAVFLEQCLAHSSAQ